MAFRKRFSRGRFIRRRRGPRVEVSQFWRSATISVSANSTNQVTPFSVAMPLLSQHALMRTAQVPSTSEVLEVYDSSIRGISLKGLTFWSDLVYTRQNAVSGSCPHGAFAVGESVYVDPMKLIDQQSNEPGLFPAPIHLPNLLSDTFSMADSPSFGPQDELFGEPNRTLFRRWAYSFYTSFNEDDYSNNVDDPCDVSSADTRAITAALKDGFGDTSLARQHPVTWAMRKIRRRAFIRDTEALWASITIGGPIPFAFNAVWSVGAVLAYRVAR